jgi:hypothetical protein
MGKKMGNSMIISRGLWLSLIAGIAIAGALSACVTRDEQPAAAAQCYWLSNQGAGWVARPDLSNAELCFEMDSCSGGAGLSGGGCYKWAAAPNAPALPWSTSSANQTLAADVPPPQDIYAGSYEMTSDCPEQGCSYGPARFSASTPLYADKDTRVRIVATIPPGECALKTGVDELLSAPRRGVVLETSGQFAAGDIIYLTNYEGEGYSTIWRRGEYISVFQDEVAVRWDERPDDPREGYWVEVRRANGQTGWARNAEIAERGCDFAGR